MDGTWVTNGNGHKLCYDAETGGCFEKVWRMRAGDT